MGDEPAFPVQDCASYQCHGMTLRDYFAGQVLAAMQVRSVYTHPDDRNAAASHAYMMADAMLEARNHKEQDT